MSSFTYNTVDSTTKAVSTITEDEAKITSEAFLSKIAPEELKSTKLVKNNHNKDLINPHFSFYYSRLNNNIPIHGDSISVAVDGLTGKVISYSIQLTNDLNLPSTDGIIDEKKGTDLVSENTKMNLSYISSLDKLNPQIEKETRLAYSNDSNTSNVIDAKTGDVLNIDKLTGVKVTFKDITPEQKEQIYANSKGTKNQWKL